MTYSLRELKNINPVAYEKFVDQLIDNFPAKFDVSLNVTILPTKRIDMFSWSGTGWNWWCEYEADQ